MRLRTVFIAVWLLIPLGVHAQVPEIEAVRNRILTWAAAWQARDLETYMDCYHPAFRSEALDLDTWLDKKEKFFRTPDPISVQITDLWVVVNGPTATATFIQDYRSASTVDTGEKTLVLEPYKGRWAIISETWRSLNRPPPRSTAPPLQASGPASRPKAPTQNNIRSEVDNLRFEAGAESETVRFDLTPPNPPVVFSLGGDRPRVVIDVRNVDIWTGDACLPAQGNWVRQIRTFRNPQTAKLRIVLDLKRADGLRIDTRLDPDTRSFSVTVRETATAGE